MRAEPGQGRFFRERSRMLGECLENVRQKSPLVHCITNYVTVNDVANVLLACGGSPIMADDPDDAAEIQRICGGLYMNIGTLNHRSVEGMRAAGREAVRLHHVLLLDPVGTGASAFRTETAGSLLNDFPLNAVRGNASELKALAGESARTKGVDASEADTVTENNLLPMIRFLKNFANAAKVIAAMTGSIDLVTDGERCFVIRNGRPEMSRITGCGCQLSGLMTAYLIANPEHQLEAAAASVCLMGLAGEIGWSRMQEGDGNSTYRNRIIDAVYNMDADTLEKRAKFEIC